MVKWIRRIHIPVVLLAAVVTISGCGMFFGGGSQEPTATPAVVRPVVPTFTPTAVTEASAPTPEPVEVAPTLVIAIDLEAAPAADAPAAATEAAAEESAPTATPQPKLTVKENAVNVRLGPGTSYGLAGAVDQGQEFTIVGSNADKSWWLICCVNGKEVWVFGDLTTRENEQFAQVVDDIPAAPQQVAQAPAEQPAAQPQPAPAEPTATPEPAPPPAADPCAGIGGDGCKFKLRGGPSFGANGGTELKLVLHFIHSGIDGGQPQGSYFVWVEKDGVKLPVSDGVRSIALVDQQGTLGKYNYEFKIGIGDIPGNNVAGNYAIWVLDGNGERDSPTFTFSVPDGQGEVWMQFDQG
jgi:hypothetical protein